MADRSHSAVIELPSAAGVSVERTRTVEAPRERAAAATSGATGGGRRDGTDDGNPQRRTRPRPNGGVRRASATAIPTRAALHLESESALAGQADLRDGRERGTPPTSPKGYHTPSRG